MKLENQVVSIDLAKKLKELGVEQEGVFYWKVSNNTLKYKDNSPAEIETELMFGITPVFKTLGTWESYTAFTVAELGEILHKTHQPIYGNTDYWSMFGCFGSSSGWEAGYYSLSDGEPIEINETTMSFSAAEEADARARMLIHLLENNLITV